MQSLAHWYIWLESVINHRFSYVRILVHCSFIFLLFFLPQFFPPLNFHICIQSKDNAPKESMYRTEFKQPFWSHKELVESQVGTISWQMFMRNCHQLLLMNSHISWLWHHLSSILWFFCSNSVTLILLQKCPDQRFYVTGEGRRTKSELKSSYMTAHCLPRKQ